MKDLLTRAVTIGGRSIANRRLPHAGSHRLRQAAGLASWQPLPHADRPSCNPFPWDQDWDIHWDLQPLKRQTSHSLIQFHEITLGISPDRHLPARLDWSIMGWTIRLLALINLQYKGES